MTLTTHASMGAVIGALTGNLWLALVCGLASHFLSDMIPHGDRALYEGHRSRTARKRAVAFVTLDGIVAIMVVSLMFATSDHTFSTVMAAGIIGAVLPDLINGVYEAFNISSLNWFNRFHFYFHNFVSDRTGDIPLSTGLLTQLIFILAIQPLF